MIYMQSEKLLGEKEMNKMGVVSIYLGQLMSKLR